MSPTLPSPTPNESASQRWIRNGRALFVLFHLTAITLAAIPAPVGGMNRKAWKTPTVQSEVRAWSDRLGVSAERLEDNLWQVARRVMTARRTILRPFLPYYHRLGTQQAWRMFVAPHTYPSRLHMDVFEQGEWRNVYVQTTEGEHWNQDVLEGDRFRSALFRYAWPRYRAPYRELAEWMATQAERDFPEATRLRLRWKRQPTPSAERLRRGDIPTGRFHSVIVTDLETP